MLNILSSVFSAIASFFGFAKDKQALENTTDMQSNANAKLIQDVRDKAINDINSPTLDQIRKDMTQ